MKNLMRFHIALLWALLCGMSAAAQVVITPSTPPTVNQGATFAFTANVPVTWSLAPGSKGTVDPTSGVYTAPAIVNAKQSYGGCQVLPNDHIFNTRIDSLPLNSNSAKWIAGAGTAPFSYEVSFPVNYVSTSTPTKRFTFNYTPLNSGSFYWPQYPAARAEGGWLIDEVTAGVDKHVITVDPNACNFQEVYQPIAVGGTPIPSCPNCNADSGVQYSGSTYSLPVNGSTDAAGMYLTPLTLKLQELENSVANGGTINHALRFTLGNGYIASSFIWPATTYTNESTLIPYGARFRLKSSFNISGFSAIAQVLLTQLKQYGVILADGGTNWATQPEYTKWPPAYVAAFQEIAVAGIGPSNFEAVDESGLEISPSSGATKSSEAVLATDSGGHTAIQNVVLTGVTVNFPKDEMYIQAGTSAQQLVAYVNGSSNTGVAWSMSPNVGTLTGGGLFTPPSTGSIPTLTTITATSLANANVKATMTLVVMPSGTMRIVMGQGSNYTDTSGNVWHVPANYDSIWGGFGGDDGEYIYGNGGSWSTIPNILLYEVPLYAHNDMRFDITVPNGNYNITGKFVDNEASSGCNQNVFDLEAQGNIEDSNVDIFCAAGGNNLSIDYTVPAIVTNGELSFVLRLLSGKVFISALEIVPVQLTPPTKLLPPTNLSAIVQ